MTLRYRIYGLNLTSDFPIPGLREKTEISANPDVIVQLGPEPEWVSNARRLPSLMLQSIPASPETKDPAVLLTSLGDEKFFQLSYSDGTCFVMDSKVTRIWGKPGDGQSMEDLATYFLGPVMGFTLRRRGTTALHASALCIDGKAVVLTGEAGAGKSTTAAALALRGFPVLCEDIASMEEVDSGFSVEVGHPRVCLWPESVEMLMGSKDALPLLSPNWDKCYFPLDGEMGSLEMRKRPLGAIYMLAPREKSANAPRVESLSSREVLLELVQNTYMNWILDRGQRAAEFALLSRLIAEVPVQRIVPHADPSRIGSLCELIAADARAVLAGKSRMAAAAGQ